MAKSWWRSSVVPPEYDWFEGQEEKRFKTKPRTRADIIAYIKKRDPHRWWRLNRDIKWIRKRLKKLGLNPEDWRELL